MPLMAEQAVCVHEAAVHTSMQFICCHINIHTGRCMCIHAQIKVHGWSFWSSTEACKEECAQRAVHGTRLQPLLLLWGKEAEAKHLLQTEVMHQMSRWVFFFFLKHKGDTNTHIRVTGQRLVCVHVCMEVFLQAPDLQIKSLVCFSSKQTELQRPDLQLLHFHLMSLSSLRHSWFFQVTMKYIQLTCRPLSPNLGVCNLQH